MEPPEPRRILICHSKACRKAGAARVFDAFQAAVGANIEIEACGCLGQCGNGPMVLVLPEQVWYGWVRPEEVAAVVEQHLQAGQPIAAMLYQPHPH